MTTAILMSLLMAFAQVESSNRNLAPYPDRNGLAFGFYGFHESRWCEMGGDPAKFGKATRLEQDAVMVVALRRYAASKPADVDLITWVSTYHNAGHGHRTPSKYTEKILRAYENQTQTH